MRWLGGKVGGKLELVLEVCRGLGEREEVRAGRGYYVREEWPR